MQVHFIASGYEINVRYRHCDIPQNTIGNGKTTMIIDFVKPLPNPMATYSERAGIKNIT